MKLHSRIIIYILIFCALSTRAQNIWIENKTDQWGCIPMDSMRIYVFDPYQYSNLDTILLGYGDGTYDSIAIEASNNIDTILFHEYPGCGTYARDLTFVDFELVGHNVSSGAFPYYFRQDVTYTTPSLFYFHNSPLFDLKYELVRCSSESFYVNTLLKEINGDSLHFELNDLAGDLPIPNSVEVNPLSGELSWTNHADTGLYHFVLYLTELRRWDQIMGIHMARFSIKVTDSCINYLIGHDNIDNNSLFETDGREFQVSTNETWNYAFRIAKEGWDSISVNPSSEIFEHSFFETDYTVTDIGDSITVNVSWITDSIYKRNHPYIITYHVTAYKNGQAHHRVLTNSIYIDWPLGLSQPEQEATYFKIHPNPTTGQTAITSTAKVKRLELFSVSGLKLEEFETLNDMSTDIDIGHLPNGLYFLRIKTEQKTVTKRIVKTTN